jgi:HEAT repeat protein
MMARAPARRSFTVLRAVRMMSLLALLPPLAAAQTPFDQDSPRTRLRDRYRSPQASQRLDENVRKLNGDDPEARLEAVRGLGELNEPKAIEYLLGAASDPDMRVRVKAIDTLGHIRAREATPLLVQQLLMRDTDLGTKRRILATLGKIGDPRATGPIVDFLSRNVDPAIRGNAIFALGDIGDRSAIPALEALARDGQDPVLRGLAVEAIRKIRERPAPPLVPPALANERRGPAGPGTP